MLNPPPSKTGTYDDRMIIGDPGAQRAHLRPRLAALSARRGRLIPHLTLPLFEAAMRAACVRLGFPKFVPHQLRHVGASHAALRRLRNARSIQRHRRW